MVPPLFRPAAEDEAIPDRPGAPPAEATEQSRAIWLEPVRGGYPDPRLFALSGLDQLRAMLAGQAPKPPISRLTGMRVTKAEEGRAEFQMPLSGWLQGPQGGPTLGAIALPADAAVACAIQTLLPPATPFTTSELSLKLIEQPSTWGQLVAVGRAIEVGRPLALAEVEVRELGGRVVASGSSFCLVTERRLPPAGARGGSDGPSRETEGQPGLPDPYRRQPPSRGEPETRLDRPGLEVLRDQITGQLALPQLHDLVGLTPVAASPGEATLEMPATEWLCAPAAHRLQGGAVALLAEAALGCAVQTTLPAGASLRTIDLKVNYVRPLMAGKGHARATARVLHGSRRVAVAGAELSGPDGRLIALASGSAMLIGPGSA